jgi:DNA-binding IclR family transcriptional regulator
MYDRRLLEAELEQVRRRGYASVESECEPFSNGVSAAVLDHRRRPLLIINVWGPDSRVPPARFPALGAQVLQVAAAVGALLR